eukprot:502485-Hanusia_phi.AAC.5
MHSQTTMLSILTCVCTGVAKLAASEPELLGADTGVDPWSKVSLCSNFRTLLYPSSSIPYRLQIRACPRSDGCNGAHDAHCSWRQEANRAGGRECKRWSGLRGEGRSRLSPHRWIQEWMGVHWCSGWPSPCSWEWLPRAFRG